MKINTKSNKTSTIQHVNSLDNLSKVEQEVMFNKAKSKIMNAFYNVK